MGNALTHLTTALTGTWTEIQAWAHDHSVFNDFLLLINTTGVTRHPQALGRVFAALDSGVARQLLAKWNDESEYAQVLHRLSVARTTPDSRLNSLRVITDIARPTAVIPENIDNYYLLALLLTRLPAVELETEKNWFERLRLWLLVHCIERAALGTRQDKHLEVACSKLRLAHDGDKGWFALFLRLRTESLNFESIGIHLSSAAKQILSAEASGNAIKPIQRKLLEALIQVAHHEHAPKEIGTQFPLPIGNPIPISERPVWDALTEDLAPKSQTEFDEPATPILIPGDEDSADLHQVTVDERVSYTHQKLQSNSILLSATEDLHFLPWSWNRPTPVEIPVLTVWLESSLASAEDATRAIATFTLIALMTGRSLRRALDISIGTSPGDEWCLDLAGKRLIRKPPRRLPGWAPETSESASWVVPLADISILPLPESAATFLLNLKNASTEADSLGALWNPSWGDTPESAFLKTMQDILPRLTPAMLGNALAQHAFLETGDGTFARMIASHPKSGLPGSTAYPSWGQSAVDAAFIGFLQPLGVDAEISPTGSSLNALGSQLTVLESLLADAIATLNAKVETIRRGESLIDFHNALTAKLLFKIYAATGARPLRDPFCSPRHFCFDEGTLFVDDKHSGKSRTGRLITLPKPLTHEIGHDYLAHLSCMSEATRRGSPELSVAISALAQAQESDQLPFFFFLTTDNGKIKWRSASEKHLRELDLFDCPLPLNLFRHRLATGLRQQGVAPELIDALLGHAESGASTHGDHSFRIWQEDMAKLQAPLESMFTALGFSTTAPWPHPLNSLAVSWEPTSSPPDFGASARTKARRIRIHAAISGAKSIIIAHRRGRDLEELSPAEIDALARALLTNDSGLPHPLGALRFSVLIKAAKKLNRESGKKLRIRHRYQQLDEESSPFSPLAPGATTLLKRLQEQAKSLDRQLTKMRLGKTDAGIIAAALLAIQSRIADKALLTDVPSEKKNIRLIHARPGFYLEHGKNLLPTDPTAPVHRHRITNAAARLINITFKRSQQRSLTEFAIPDALTEIADTLVCANVLKPNAKASDLIDAMTKLIDQANIQTFPGVIAGYLGGRIESASLEWRDWSRLRWNRRIAVDALSPPLSEDTPEDELPSRIPDSKDIEVLQKEARSLFSTLGKQLDPNEEASSLTANVRRNIKSALRQTLTAADGKAPRTCLLLGAWLVSLLERKSNHNDFLARNTIKRYFGALSPAFAEVGYAIDLELADEDEITEFYCEVIEGRETDNPSYVFARLKEFHRWLSQQVETEDPVWADLPYHDGSVSVDPGIVVESDYLRAFNLLARQGTNHEASKYAALLLLGAYRFGLRGGEVLGLLRADWVNVGDYSVLIVENNRHRRLKRKSSRRVVPLLTPPTPAENALIKWAVAAAEARSGDDRQALLFPSATKKSQQQIRRLALNALKSVTGNPDSNLHRLRHTAANQVMLGLCGISLATWQQVGAVGTKETVRTQELLLGRIGPTRRAAWACARYLGHAGPQTAFRSYYHFISDLAEQCIALPNEATRQYEHAIDLGDFKLLRLEYTIPSPTSALPLYGQAELIIKSLRLLARGKSEEEIADWMGWESLDLARLIAVVKKINFKMYGNEPKLSNETSDGFYWLTRIRNAAWNRMVNEAPEVDRKIDSLGAPAIPIETIIQIVGSSRQLLAWKPQQFRALAQLCALWNIPDAQYSFFMVGKNNQVGALASEFGFKPEDPKGHGRRASGQQIDAALDEDEFVVHNRPRCSLCLKESNETVIRNRFELIVALMSTYCCEPIEHTV